MANSNLINHTAETLLTASGAHYTVIVKRTIHPVRGTDMAPLFIVKSNYPNSRTLDAVAHWPNWSVSSEDLAISLASAPRDELIMFCGDVRYRTNSGWKCRTVETSAVVVHRI